LTAGFFYAFLEAVVAVIYICWQLV